jgi:hypothetical protein
MNYGELKQAILDDTHRADLSTHVERFVRQAEGMLRRQLTGYELSTTITDTDRVADGLFSLPARVLIVRSIHLQGRQGDALHQVSPAAVRRLDATADVLQFCLYGSDQIEFRGVPGSSQVFDIRYFGTPAPFASDSDENDLLTDHESLYMAAGKFFLYQHTQDRELAKDEIDIFTSIVDDLNEATARKISGANIAPVYNFSGGSSY